MSDQNIKKSKYPDLTKQPIHNVDATPNAEFPIRILEAYLANCDCNWFTDTDGNCDNPLFELMNKHNKERAVILNRAINILKRTINDDHYQE